MESGIPIDIFHAFGFSVVHEVFRFAFKVKFQLFGNLFICLLNVFGELTLSVFW